MTYEVSIYLSLIRRSSIESSLITQSRKSSISSMRIYFIWRTLARRSVHHDHTPFWYPDVHRLYGDLSQAGRVRAFHGWFTRPNFYTAKHTYDVYGPEVYMWDNFSYTIYNISSLVHSCLSQTADLLCGSFSETKTNKVLRGGWLVFIVLSLTRASGFAGTCIEWIAAYHGSLNNTYSQIFSLAGN